MSPDSSTGARLRALIEKLIPWLTHSDGCGALVPPYSYCSCGLNYAYHSALAAVAELDALLLVSESHQQEQEPTFSVIGFCAHESNRHGDLRKAERFEHEIGRTRGEAVNLIARMKVDEYDEIVVFRDGSVGEDTGWLQDDEPMLQLAPDVAVRQLVLVAERAEVERVRKEAEQASKAAIKERADKQLLAKLKAKYER